MYNKKVLDHFNNPRNMGEIKDASGVGDAGNPICGDMMKLFIVVEDGIIKDIGFKTFGCGAAIASSSALTEMVKGMTVDEAEKLSKQDVVNFLGDLPSHKIHCSVLAVDALKRAIEDWRANPEKHHEEQKENC